jgi:tRNA G10  N-methylase Trm11
MSNLTKHPAVMGQHILSICSEFLPKKGCRVLDPFAGIGTTARLLTEYDVVGVEIEVEWAEQNESVICGDSLVEVPKLGKFDAVLTSPAYGNRMADDFNAGDGSKRITYRHRLGRCLSDGTTANLHFGRKNKKYETLHKNIWRVCVDALKDGGVFILNCKDFIAGGETMTVTDWHINTLTDLGLELVNQKQVQSKGMRFGKNSEKRIAFENVVCLQKRKTKHG